MEYTWLHNDRFGQGFRGACPEPNLLTRIELTSKKWHRVGSE